MIEWLKNAIAFFTKANKQVAETKDPPPKLIIPPVNIKHPNIKDLANSLAKVETSNFDPKTLGMRNRNPINLRYAGQPNAKPDARQFCVFDSMEHGWQAAYNQLTLVCSGYSLAYSQAAHELRLKDSGELTLQEFISVFAPASDNNSPKAYANTVAKDLGISVDFIMRKFL